MTDQETEVARQVAKLAPHGLSMWEALAAKYTLNATNMPLVLQACRIIDRLDRLEGALKSNKTWIRIADESELRPGAIKITVTIDSVLAEARQQAIALTQILNKLGVGKLSDEIPQGGGFDDFLAGLRESR